MSEIALFSTSIDEPTYAPVAEKLANRGYNTFLYLADRVANGTDRVAFTVSNSNAIELVYNGSVIELPEVKSAWFRHPNLVGLNYEDKAKQQSVENEVVGIQDSLWAAIPESSWLNSPLRMRIAGAKLFQLSLAKQLGFNTPVTVISNDWDTIDEVLAEEEIVVKMNTGLLYGGNKTKAFYTKVLSADGLLEARSANPFPAIFQRYLSKKREWRVTVVGQKVFEAAIYTEDSAKDDWRIHQLTDKVKFREEALPLEERQLCIDYLGHLGLSYGAFDLVENYEGKITFLECNPNGQYKWLEDLLGMRISDSIVDELITRYKKQLRENDNYKSNCRNYLHDVY